jgi:hypothetical protein
VLQESPRGDAEDARSFALRLQTLLGINLPIIQAPMAAVQAARLVVAVITDRRARFSSMRASRPGCDDPLRGDGKVWPRRCKGTVRGWAR